MMMLINCLSLVVITVSLSIGVLHPRISFPAHVDAIMFLVAIGTCGIFINTVLDLGMQSHLQNAEIWVRFGLACLLVKFVQIYLREHKREND